MNKVPTTWISFSTSMMRQFLGKFEPFFVDRVIFSISGNYGQTGLNNCEAINVMRNKQMLQKMINLEDMKSNWHHYREKISKKFQRNFLKGDHAGAHLFVKYRNISNHLLLRKCNHNWWLMNPNLWFISDKIRITIGFRSWKY